MACKTCGSQIQRDYDALRARNAAARPSGEAAQAAVATNYEVLTASGTPSGRRFSSLVAASSFASRIGGSTRPVR